MFKHIITAAVAAITIVASTSSAQSTIFTYQGTLNDAGAPADGFYDLRFRIWDDFTPGAPDNQIGIIVTVPAVTVTEGLFTVNLDFGADAFTTTGNRYFQIDVRQNGAPTYTTLTPRQRITPTPRAINATQATTSLLTQGLELPITATGTDSDLNAFDTLFHITNFGTDGVAVRGDGKSIGVLGFGTIGFAFPGIPFGTGVAGISNASGIFGSSATGEGVSGVSLSGTGGFFKTSSNSEFKYGVYGFSELGSTAGLFEINEPFSPWPALIARTDSTQNSAFAIQGIIESPLPGSFSTAVRGENRGTGGFGIGVWGSHNGSGWGIYGKSTSGLAGRFQGDVTITGTLIKSGGSFKIDHPLDPANMYLSHSFVESPDMKNIYDGVIILDESGSATVTLPTYFNALNQEFRYQLTCIGGYAPVFIKSEITDRSFIIAGGNEGLKISWQVTGVRHDAWANQNRIIVEEQKSSQDQGKYLNPAAFGQPKENGIDYIQSPDSQN